MYLYRGSMLEIKRKGHLTLGFKRINNFWLSDSEAPYSNPPGELGMSVCSSVRVTPPERFI